MKKLLIILAFVLLKNLAFGQIFTYPNQGSYGTAMQRLSVDSVLFFPTASGAPTDSTYLNCYGFGHAEKKAKAALYYDSTGHHLYVWDPSTKSWSLTGSGGGGGITVIHKGWGMVAGDITTSGTVTVDSTQLSAYYLRRVDSPLYATQTQLAAKLSGNAALNQVLFGNGINSATSSLNFIYNGIQDDLGVGVTNNFAVGSNYHQYAFGNTNNLSNGAGMQFAFGTGNSNSSVNSSVFGHGLTANALGHSQFIVGDWNDSTFNGYFAIGGGTSNTSRRNLLGIDSFATLRLLPTPTSARNPFPAYGDLHNNSTLGLLEMWNGGSWVPWASGSGSGGFTPRKVSISGLTGLSTFGDSYTTGFIAINPSQIYVDQLRDSLSLTLSNVSVNASGFYNILNQVFQKNYNGSTRTDLATILGGVLDVISNGSSQATQTKVYNISKSIIANCLMSTVVSASNATYVTASGFSGITTASVNTISRSSNISSSNIMTSTTSGSSLTYAFTGDNIVIGTYASTSAAKIGGINISIDGNSYSSYSGNGTVSGIGTYSVTGESGVYLYPNAIVIRGLSSGAHSVVVTANTFTSSGSPVYVDYFGVMPATASAKPVLFSDVVHFDIGVSMPVYGLPVMPNANRDGDILSKEVHRAINLFTGYPVASVDINNFWNPYLDVQRPDNLHPQQSGENDLYSAFKFYISNVPQTGIALGAPSEYNPLNINTDQLNSFIQNQNAGTQNAGAAITGPLTVNGLETGARGYSGSPSFFTTNYLNYISNGGHLFQTGDSSNAAYPYMQLSSYVYTQPSSSQRTNYKPISGFLQGFNYYANNTPNAPLYITTDGYGLLAAGDINIMPAVSQSVYGPYGGQYGNYNILLSPSGNGYVNTGRAKFYSGLSYNRTAVANANYTALTSDYRISYTSITASRAVTLPSASAFPGQHLVINDESGNASSTNSITIVGTVNGVANPTAINSAFGGYSIYSNGTGWFTSGTASGGGGGLSGTGSTGYLAQWNGASSLNSSTLQYVTGSSPQYTRDLQMSFHTTTFHLFYDEGSSNAAWTNQSVPSSSYVGNTIFGTSLLPAWTGSPFNTAIGYSHMSNVTTGGDFTTIGSSILRNISATSTKDIAIGDHIGETYMTGLANNNIFIGRQIDLASTFNLYNTYAIGDSINVSVSNAVYLGRNNQGVIFPTGNTTAMNALTATDGMHFFNTDSACTCVYSASLTKWRSMCGVTAGGGGSTNLNIGSGYRLAIPGTNNIKTLFFTAGRGIIADSTTNTNGITEVVDTATLFPQVRASVPGYFNAYFNSGLHSVNDSTVRLGTNPLLEDVHIDGSNAFNFYFDSLHLYMTALVLQIADTSGHKLMVWNTSTKEVQAMSWPVLQGQNNNIVNPPQTAGTSFTSLVGITQINPASIVSAMTITMPASPAIGDRVVWLFGGTITSGNTVITTLTIAGNTGQTVLGSLTLNTAKGYDAAEFEYIGSNTWWRMP